MLIGAPQFWQKDAPGLMLLPHFVQDGLLGISILSSQFWNQSIPDRPVAAQVCRSSLASKGSC